MEIKDILEPSEYDSLNQFTSDDIEWINGRINTRRKGEPGIECVVRGKNNDGDYFKLTPEEIVRQYYAYKLITEYGYDKEQLSLEEPVLIAGKTIDTDKRIDIAVFDSEHKKIQMIIEVKRPRITNYHKNWDGEGSTPYQQMYSYCSQKKSQLGVLVNGVSTPEFYDYIIVDEFHHAAAPTYQKLLNYYQPKILLGLTATPERMDGKSILPYFNNRIAAEIRLPEAIDRKLLCPFQYFGVTDTVDLDALKWSAGGYQKGELEHIYTFSGAVADRRADHVVTALLKYVTDIDEVKGLGFCVTVDHAEFMCRYFNDHNIPSMCLTGQSSDEERAAAKRRLVSGDVRFIFVVDIYNEGVDIPEVNTVLFLRPTESLTIFLQQLGRGLRLAEDKECLTVLDFIGQANRKYNFEDKFAALLSNTTRSVSREIKDGFVSVPKGCYIQLEKKAAKYILENIRASYGNTAGLVARAASFAEDSGLELTLKNFLDYYHLDPRAIYKFSSFSRICARADAIEDFSEPLEDILTKAFAKLAVVDSRRWISFLLDVLPHLDNLDFAALPDTEKRMMQMFYITVWGKTVEDWDDEEVLSNLYALSDSTVLLGELLELLRYRFEQIDFIDEPVELGFDCPLDLHCTYTRDQLLVALDFMKPSTVREGVKWLQEKSIDVFFVTLNKADKDYSPTTMYNDYSINESLFHWQSQSTTAENSPTGQRYIHHKERGSKVLLFVREFKADRMTGGAEAYTYLGTANYVKHTGSKPMNITWQLDRPIPAKFLKKTNKFGGGLIKFAQERHNELEQKDRCGSEPNHSYIPGEHRASAHPANMQSSLHSEARHIVSPYRIRYLAYPDSKLIVQS